MKRASLFPIAVLLALILSACGGDGGPSVRLVVEADLSPLSEAADPDQVMAMVADILEGRATAFGATDVDIEPGEGGRLTITVPGVMSGEDLRQLMEPKAHFELVQPVLNSDGDVVCQTENIAFSSTSREEVIYERVTPDGPALPRCKDEDGVSRTITWESLGAGPGPEGALSIIVLRPASAVVDRTQSPVVVVNFSPQDVQPLAEVTERLQGLPLGMFLDAELIAGPTISAPITTGNVAVGGMSLTEAEILAALINGGELPVDVTVISVEETP